MSRKLYTPQGDGSEMPSYDNKSRREPDGSEVRPIYIGIDLLRKKGTYTANNSRWQADLQGPLRNIDRGDSL